MRFSYRSPQQLFTPALKEYCQEKLAKPVTRLKMDGKDGTRFDIEAHEVGENLGVRVLFAQPGLQVTVSTLHKDPYAAVDLAADKLGRKLRDIEERRRAKKRRPSRASLTDEDTDIFTEDEEEVLRKMGALDDVLNL